VIGADATLGDVLLTIGESPAGILVLPVVDAEGRLQGMLHANDLLQR
jgi:CBS domain-containing protein